MPASIKLSKTYDVDVGKGDASSSSSSHHASHLRNTRSDDIGDDAMVVLGDDDKEVTANDGTVDEGSITESGDEGRGDNVGSRRNCGWCW